MDGQPFGISIQHVKAMLADPEFYTSCVAYLFMREMGLSRTAAYQTALLERAAKRKAAPKKKGCGTCGRANPEQVIKPAIITFKHHTRDLYDVSPIHLQPVADYLRGKLDYRPSHFVMYIKKPDKSRRELQFGTEANQ